MLLFDRFQHHITRWFSCRISEPSTVADVIFPWGFLSSLVVFWEDLASAESNVGLMKTRDENLAEPVLGIYNEQ